MTRLALAGAVLLAFSRQASAAAWSEYRTEHFILDTDAPDVANEMMDTLEKARATDMAVLAGGELDLLGRIRVVAPRSDEEFRETAGKSLVRGVLHAGSTRRANHPGAGQGLLRGSRDSSPRARARGLVLSLP
jgi:hypothetical protein